MSKNADFGFVFSEVLAAIIGTVIIVVATNLSFMSPVSSQLNKAAVTRIDVLSIVFIALIACAITSEIHIRKKRC